MHKGKDNPFYGKKHTPEALKKISMSGKGREPWNKGIKQWKDKKPPRLGCKLTKETKNKISKSLKGKLSKEKNPAWRGGKQTEDKIMRVKFRKTMQRNILERDNYTCQLCNKRGVNLHVDHIIPWSKNTDLRFEMDNCRTLCKSCHYEITYNKPLTDEKLEWGHNLMKGAN